MAYLAISHVCLYIEELIQFTVQLVYVSDKLKDKCLTVIYENFAKYIGIWYTCVSVYSLYKICLFH